MPSMTTRRYEDKLHIDMPFDEALERFASVDPKEMHANITKSKKKKPPGGKKTQAVRREQSRQEYRLATRQTDEKTQSRSLRGADAASSERERAAIFRSESCNTLRSKYA